MKHIKNFFFLYILIFPFTSDAQDETLVVIENTVSTIDDLKCDVKQWQDKIANSCTCCLVKGKKELEKDTKKTAKSVFDICTQQGSCNSDLIKKLLADVTGEDEEEKYRTVIDSLYENALVIKQVTASKDVTFDKDGNFTEKGLQEFLQEAYKQKKLPFKDFEKVDCLKTTDIFKGEKGYNTEQLFIVKSDCNPKHTEFIVKGLKNKLNEPRNLAKSKLIQEIAPYTYPDMVDGFPVIIFPLAFISYKDKQNREHILSIMPKSQGVSLEKFMIAYNLDASAENLAKAKKAYYQAGRTMANYHKTFMRDKNKLIAALHGDAQHKNIYYDVATNRTWWIDTESISQYFESGDHIGNDILHLLFASFEVSPILTGKKLKDWERNMAESLLEGYLSVYTGNEQREMVQKLIPLFRIEYKLMQRYKDNGNKSDTLMPYVTPVINDLEKKYAGSDLTSNLGDLRKHLIALQNKLK